VRRLAALLLAVALATASPAQDAPPGTGVPARLRAFIREAPTVLLEEDARRLGERAVPPVPPAAPKAPAPAGGVSRTITLDPPPVVNRSTRFQFRDVTERAASDGRVRSMEERRATVEALRQSLGRQGR
jgi:hypothetical protein